MTTEIMKQAGTHLQSSRSRGIKRHTFEWRL